MSSLWASLKTKIIKYLLRHLESNPEKKLRMKETTMNAKIKNITKKAWKEQLDKPSLDKPRLDKPVNASKIAAIKAPKGKCSKKKK